MTGWTRTGHRLAQRGITQAFAIVGLFVLSACSPIHIASRTIDFGFGGSSQTTANQTMTPLTAAGPGQVFGRGPVQVALLLPLTGNAGLASVGQSMANGSRLAMAFIEANPNIAENTTITLRDTGGTVAGATSATQAALASGAKPPAAGSTAQRVLLWAGLIATLAVVVLVTRTARRALARSVPELEKAEKLGVGMPDIV